MAFSLTYETTRVAVVGLVHGGSPLAVVCSKFPVSTGFDINAGIGEREQVGAGFGLN